MTLRPVTGRGWRDPTRGFNPSREPEQTAALRAVVSEPPSGGNLVLVSHGSIIYALTGTQPAPGEFVV